MANSNLRGFNRPPRRLRLNEDEFVKLLQKAEELPLRIDMITLLTYVRDTKIVGTQNTGNMPLKLVREVTARFINPPILDTKIGDHIYKLRSEEDVWPLYFLHVLAEVGDLLATPRAKVWRLKKSGKEFLEANPLQQITFLLNVWWYNVNWLIAYPVSGLGDNLPDNFNLQTLSSLDALPVNTPTKFKDFADHLINATGLNWHSQSQEFVTSLLHGSIERIVIKILEKFDMIDCEYHDKPFGNSTIQELVEFRINRFGKAMLNTLKMMSQRLT